MALRFTTAAGSITDASKWNGGTLPTSADTAELRHSMTAGGGGSFTAATLTKGSGGLLNITGSFTFNCNINGGSGRVPWCSGANNLTINVTVNGDMTISGDYWHAVFQLIVCTNVTANWTVNGNVTVPASHQGAIVRISDGSSNCHQHITINGNLTKANSNTSAMLDSTTDTDIAVTGTTTLSAGGLDYVTFGAGGLVISGGTVGHSCATPAARPLAMSGGTVYAGTWAADLTLSDGMQFSATLNGNLTLDGGNAQGATVNGSRLYQSGSFGQDEWTALPGATLGYGQTISGGTINGDLTIDGGTYGGEGITGTLTYISGNIVAGEWFDDLIVPSYADNFGGSAIFHGSVLFQADGTVSGGTYHGPVDGPTIYSVYGATFFATAAFPIGTADISTFHGDAILNSLYAGNVFHDRLSLDGGATWLYSPSSPDIAAPNDVRAGINNAGSAGTIMLPDTDAVDGGVGYGAGGTELEGTGMTIATLQAELDARGLTLETISDIQSTANGAQAAAQAGATDAAAAKIAAAAVNDKVPADLAEQLAAVDAAANAAQLAAEAGANDAAAVRTLAEGAGIHAVKADGSEIAGADQVGGVEISEEDFSISDQ